MNTREKIISALEISKGHFLSGEELAEQIGVSRNSVWKAVKTLKEQGYSIEAVTNKGYRLSEYSDVISKEGIALYLNDKSIAECIEVYEEISSTNDLAKKYLFVDVPRKMYGTDKNCHIIIAKEQTGGRGHKKSTFSSPKGGIYMSIVLPAEKVETGKGKKNVSKLVRNSVIRSVNDMFGIKLEEGENHGIYNGGEKICGIMTEVLSDYEEGTISDYILGIGIRYDMLLNQKVKAEGGKNKLIADIVNKILY